MCRRKSLIHLSLFSILLIGQLNCAVFAQTVKVKFGETFILQPNETAETEDGKLKIRLNGIGRTISESGETEYAELKIWFNRSEQTITISESGNLSKNVGKYIIKLVNAESFGKANCRLKISRRK